jgi:hypothetical protein
MRDGRIRKKLKLILKWNEMERIKNLKMVSEYEDELWGNEDKLDDEIGKMINVKIK